LFSTPKSLLEAGCRLNSPPHRNFRDTAGSNVEMRWLRWLYWLAMIPAYWYCAFRLLEHMSPAFIDGGGAVAGFYWGEHWPTADLPELNLSHRLPKRFMYPYWIAAALVTVRGWCAARLQRPARTMLAMLLVVAAASDAGDVFRLWRSARFLFDTRSVIVLLFEFMIPMALLTWLLAAGRKAVDYGREYQTRASSIDGGAAGDCSA
jgi:hypothetical protein